MCIDVVGELRGHLSLPCKDTILLLISEVLPLVPNKVQGEKLRKVLLANPSQLIDMINGDIPPPGAKGKTSLGTLWLWVALLRWVLRKNNKPVAWDISVGDNLMLTCCTMPEKLLEKVVSDLISKMYPSPPIPTVESLFPPPAVTDGHVATLWGGSSKEPGLGTVPFFRKFCMKQLRYPRILHQSSFPRLLHI